MSPNAADHDPVDQPLDVAGMQQLLSEHTGYLTSYIAERLPASIRIRVSPDDVLQDVLTAAFQGRASFRSFAPDSFKRWITTIADRKLIDLKRVELAIKRGGNSRRRFTIGPTASSSTRFRQPPAAPTRTPSREVSTQEARRLLLIGVSGLPPAMQEAVRLHDIEGKPIDEVARKMDITEAALRSLLYRGRVRLREVLGDPSRYFSESKITPPARRSGSSR